MYELTIWLVENEPLNLVLEEATVGYLFSQFAEEEPVTLYATGEDGNETILFIAGGTVIHAVAEEIDG